MKDFIRRLSSRKFLTAVSSLVGVIAITFYGFEIDPEMQKKVIEFFTLMGSIAVTGIGAEDTAKRLKK